MPNFGLSHPWIAKLNTQTGQYSDAFRCGKAVNTTVTPNYGQGSMYADDQQTEEVTEFKNAGVDLGVDTLPIKAGEVMFGHTVSEDGEETSNVSDSGAYVGYGFTTTEMTNGIKKYRACLLKKVKFTEGAESYTTKGDSITFSNPTLSGTAMAIGVGEKPEVWRIKSPKFNTNKEADDWIQKQLGASKSTSDASDTGGTSDTGDTSNTGV